MCSSMTDAKWFSCLNIDNTVAMCVSSACVGPDWLIVSVTELGNTLIKKLMPYWAWQHINKEVNAILISQIKIFLQPSTVWFS